MMRVSALGQALVRLIYPQARCLCCDEPRQIDVNRPLCGACEAALQDLLVGEDACGHCLSPRAGGQPCAYCAGGGMLGLDQAFAPYVYREQARQLILRLKFGPVELAAQPLAQEMALQISGIRFDALVPMPLHSSRLRERGMNQSQVLARLISQQTGYPVLEALQKTRKIRRQSTLPAAARAANVKGALALAGEVKGLQLLLVDDVRTTGATAREAAGVLRAGGAAGVCLLTAAVATGGQHGAA